MDFEIRKPSATHTGPHSTPPFTAFVSFLEANIGVWAVYHSYTSRDSAKQRTRKARAMLAAEGFQFTTRREGDVYTVYGKKSPALLDLAHTH